MIKLEGKTNKKHKLHLDTVDGSEIPNNHLGCFISNPVNHGISTTNFQPQLVSLPDF